ncbi:MAG: ATP:cob(I)alamin adenosyltransferase [Gammaproteobacteria bacterium RIFCSPHIGHO2_12_FULL_41_15]|nr:MAG: ATP:cob(I)alamin adenosyltransferase [Gammaproteobacteria bacterium RIFCSPHIGHO2_12_FULL_41_15]
MVRLTKIYTKRGDQGETDLAGGHRIAKHSLRIEVIGVVDEVNAAVGFAIEALKQHLPKNILIDQCRRIQNELFNLGSQIAVLQQDRRENTPVIQLKNIEQLEIEIDEMNANLAPLKSFVLPGGSETAARLHLARTECRKAERAAVALARTEKSFELEILAYLNRLSDWLFVASRSVNATLQVEEILWQS